MPNRFGDFPVKIQTVFTESVRKIDEMHRFSPGFHLCKRWKKLQLADANNKNPEGMEKKMINFRESYDFPLDFF